MHHSPDIYSASQASQLIMIPSYMVLLQLRYINVPMCQRNTMSQHDRESV